jgi:hypothetical protein
MKTIQFKCVAIALISALSLASQSFAVDVAEAASVMADLDTLAIQAKANLANASLNNLGATDEANQQSVAIDEAVEAGREALADMEQAVANGDDEAAEAAEDALASALRQAKAVLAGVLTAAVATSSDEQADESQDDSGEEPEGGWGSPNIYDQPWQTTGIRAYYESLFGAFQDASGFGDQKAFGNQNTTPDLTPPDFDATPE